MKKKNSKNTKGKIVSAAWQLFYEQGYDNTTVEEIVDASGTFNKTTRNAAIARMQQAGAQMITWFAMASELQRDWRDNGDGLKKIYCDHLLEYDALVVAHDAEK